MNFVAIILDRFNLIYRLLYDGIITAAPGTMDKGDAWLSDPRNKPLLIDLCKMRGDIFSSDREVIALALALNL